jgi:hypothetical protein
MLRCVTGHAMAQAVSRQPLAAEAWASLGFVVDGVILR